MPNYYPIHDLPNFDPVVYAEKVDKAIRAGEKEQVGKLIAGISNRQRQQLKEPYRVKYGKELIASLDKKFSGDLEDLLLALVDTPLEYDLRQLHQAMKGAGTDEDALIEIICSRTPDQIEAIRKHFELKYGSPLVKWVADETSGEFKDLLVAIVNGSRDTDSTVNEQNAKDDAVRLFADGKGKFANSGKDEGSHFLKILASQNQYQLRKVFEEFEKLSGQSIEKAIEKEFKGDLQKSYLAIVRSTTDKQKFFAMQLNKSMKGLGTKDNDLIRALVARSEVDLNLIKDAYKELYKKTLEDDIKGDTSGAYRETLLAICAGNQPLV